MYVPFFGCWLKKEGILLENRNVRRRNLLIPKTRRGTSRRMTHAEANTTSSITKRDCGRGSDCDHGPAQISEGRRDAKSASANLYASQTPLRL
jgi:hypothetical protein